ncbi:ribosomal protein L34-domain-containing protein [Syncephalastrum racemosum]|uniref:Large ribosomal subunit protein bL34m n=1 Tax=Syncephalastrum racemosum TaxID=13706 RepID=A0A1X2H622_SYNRA|nr:ribosomal protein L34-domain-containing protein [Syncephalastrum racemosum]
MAPRALLGAAAARPTVAASTMTASQATPSLLGSSLFSWNPFASTQARFISYGNSYQPSNLVRKRRHGFLSRITKKSGRRVLQRRLAKGRKNMSH